MAEAMESNPSGGFKDPDAELVHAAKAGNFDAFEQLVTRHERAIYTLSLRIVQNPQDAEEVVQETFLSVVEHLRQFEEKSLFRTWLVRIATNHALHVLRKRRGLRTVPLDLSSDENPSEAIPRPDFIAPWQDDPGRLVERRETRHLLSEALGNLEEKYRLVFVLRDVEGLSTEETAETLGISVPNVKVRLLRARLMLREMLTKQFGKKDPESTGRDQ